MLQRIQTIFLLLAAVAVFLLFANPFTLFEVDNTQGLAAGSPLSDKVFNIHDNIILVVLVVAAGLLALGAIFLYKNRRQQMTATRLSVILSIVLAVASGVLFYMDYQALTGDTNIEGGYGLLSPILGMIFGILALRFISKDEKLVRSMDRLR